MTIMAAVKPRSLPTTWLSRVSVICVHRIRGIIQRLDDVPRDGGGRILDCDGWVVLVEKCLFGGDDASSGHG